MSDSISNGRHTGLEAYDGFDWKDWKPEVDLIHRQGGLGTLLQRAPRGAIGGTEIVAPANPDTHMFLFSTTGTDQIDYRINGKPYRSVLRPWDAFVLPSETESWWAVSPSAVHGMFHIHLEKAFLKEFFEAGLQPDSDFGPNSDPTLRDPALSGVARVFLSELKQKRVIDQVHWESLATVFSMRIGQLWQTDLKRNEFISCLAPWQTKRVVEYIVEHCARQLSITELAAITGLSPYHFCRAFKHSTGIPPHRYQLKLRVERAKDLLATSRLSISDVAAEVGYEDQGQLARLFRKEAGMTPSQYRRERQG